MTLFGPLHGVESVRDIVEALPEIGIGYLTLYAFRYRNWTGLKMKLRPDGTAG